MLIFVKFYQNHMGRGNFTFHTTGPQDQ